MSIYLNFIIFYLVISLTRSYLMPQTRPANILGVFISSSKSHLLINLAIAETLASQGHNVTVMGSYANPHKNYKYNYVQLDVSRLEQKLSQKSNNETKSVYLKISTAIAELGRIANATMQHSNMRNFLATHRPGDFNVLILDYVLNDFMLGLAAHFQCPIIISSVTRTTFIINAMLGNPSEISYVPTLLSSSVLLKQPLNFWSRLQNALFGFLEQCVILPIILAEMKKLYSLNFPPDRYAPLEEVYKNVSLVLTNHHFSQGPIRPNVPALIEIGGIQIKEQPDALPADIQAVMDSAKNGVIYFSLGTNVQGSNLSKDKALMIFKVLSQLPYTVLLKWGDSDFPGHAENIIYKTWLPQDDILAHPKVKLFITHGGQGSVVESQYHGVPMVGIPFFGDQHSNMATVEKSGFGLSLEYATLSETVFRNAVLDVLQNRKYAENVKQFSKLYRDRPMTPRQLVRYWVDYVIRHNGAKHMQSPAVYLSWWQLHSLDVIAFLLAVISMVLAAIVAGCKCICCRGKSVTKSGQKLSKTKQN